MADDYDYVPKLNCDQAVNLNNPDCDSTIHNVYSQTNARCSSSNYCPPSSKPIGIRSHVRRRSVPPSTRLALHSP